MKIQFLPWSLVGKTANQWQIRATRRWKYWESTQTRLRGWGGRVLMNGCWGWGKHGFIAFADFFGIKTPTQVYFVPSTRHHWTELGRGMHDQLPWASTPWQRRAEAQKHWWQLSCAFDLSAKSFLNRKILPRSLGAQNPQHSLNSRQGIWTNGSSESSFVTEGRKAWLLGSTFVYLWLGRVFSIPERLVCADHQLHTLRRKIHRTCHQKNFSCGGRMKSVSLVEYGQINTQWCFKTSQKLLRSLTRV